MWSAFITCYSLPTCFDLSHGHHQGKLSWYIYIYMLWKRTTLFIILNYFNTNCSETLMFRQVLDKNCNILTCNIYESWTINTLQYAPALDSGTYSMHMNALIFCTETTKLWFCELWHSVWPWNELPEVQRNVLSTSTG